MAVDKFGALVSSLSGLVCKIQSAALPKGTSGMDIEKAVTYLLEHAEEGSIHQCAKYVRLAIGEGGGVHIVPWPVPAKEYGPFLRHYGFISLPIASCTPIKGDICVFQPYKGGSTAGHIQMFTGEEWCSDFVQEGFWPGPKWAEKQPSYAVYRP
jgi:hypothetical protein